MLYHCIKNGKGGVGIVLAAKFLESILSIKKISDRLMHLRFVFVLFIYLTLSHKILDTFNNL